MALISSGFESTVTLVDQGGNRSTLSYQMNPATVTDMTEALSAQVLLNVALNALTDSEIASYSVAERFKESALTLPTSAQNENKASISFTKSGGGLGNLKVPAPIADAFVDPVSGANNNIVKLDATQVTNYTTFFTTGNKFLINDGEFLVQLVKGKRVHSKNNNG